MSSNDSLSIQLWADQSREVFPTAIAGQKKNRSTIEAGSDLKRRSQSHSRGRPREDATFQRKSSCHPEGIEMSDAEFRIHEFAALPFQKKRGFMILNEAAHTLDRVTTFRFGGDNGHRGIPLLEKSADADKRSSTSNSCNEMRDVRDIPPNLRTRCFEVRAGIRLTGILIQQAPVGILLREFVCFLDGAAGAEFGGGKNHIGAKDGKDLTALPRGA